MDGLKLARLGCLLGLGAGVLSGQIVATFHGSAGATHAGPSRRQFGAGAAVGVALTPLRRSVQLDWNAIELEAAHRPNGTGAAVDTNLEAWLSPGLSLRRNAPLLLAQAGVGRGAGLGGFGLWGAGAGWRAGAWVPYVEYRRRAVLGGGSGESEIVAGIHWLIWE